MSIYYFPYYIDIIIIIIKSCSSLEERKDGYMFCESG